MQRKANPAALKKVTGLAFLRHFVRCIPKSEGDLPRGTLQLREEHGFDAPVGDALNVVKRADRPGHVAGIVIDRYGDAPVADLTFLVMWMGAFFPMRSIVFIIQRGLSTKSIYKTPRSCSMARSVPAFMTLAAWFKNGEAMLRSERLDFTESARRQIFHVSA